MVEFGQDNVGSVGLTGTRVKYSGGRGRLTIQQLINKGEIGKTFDPNKDVTELPKVLLNFNEVASVDAMIDVLKKVKEFMEAPDPDAYTYAA